MKTNRIKRTKVKERAAPPAPPAPRRLIKWEHIEADDELEEYWETEIKLSNGEKVARIFIMCGYIMKQDEHSGAPTTKSEGWGYEVEFDERADSANLEGYNFANRAGAEAFALDALAQVLEECATRLRNLIRSIP